MEATYTFAPQLRSLHMITKHFFKSKDEVDVVFDIAFPTDADQVAVVLGANGWEPQPMRRTADGWRLKLRLTAGAVYQFRYLTSDGVWMNDASADGHVDNGFGSENSVIDATKH